MGAGRRVRWLPVARPGRAVAENLAVLSESRRLGAFLSCMLHWAIYIFYSHFPYSFTFTFLTRSDGAPLLEWSDNPWRWPVEATGELTQSSFSQGDFFYGGDRSFSEGGLKYQFNELGFLDLQYVAISFLISIHLCQS